MNSELAEKTEQRLGEIASLTAIAVATSTILIYIPNVETITLTIFLAGFVYGRKTGIATGITTSLLWEVIASSLLGGFSGVVFPFKLVFWVFTGWLGAWSRQHKIIGRKELMILGGSLGLGFDLVVTLGVVIPIMTVSGTTSFLVVYAVYFLQGLPFFTFPHILGNMLLFSFIPLITRAMLITIHGSSDAYEALLLEENPVKATT